MKLSRFALLGLALNLLFLPVSSIADAVDPTTTSLGARSPTLYPIVTGSGDAEDLSDTSVRSFSDSATRQRDLDDTMVWYSVLSDSTYNATGFLTTSANVGDTLNPLSSGGARSDFATQDADGFFVDVDATPVPESSSILLLGIGIIVLSLIYRLHKAKRAR